MFIRIGNNETIVLVRKKRDNFRNSRKTASASRQGTFFGKKFCHFRKSDLFSRKVKKSLVKLPDLGSLDPKEHFYAKKT